MATLKQIEANCRNAQKSTGPQSAEGKAASSRNAEKHALTGAHILFHPGEEDIFAAFSASLLAEVAPEGEMGHQLFSQLLHASWSLRNTRRAETGVAYHDPAHQAPALDRYFRRHERSFWNARRQLIEAQTARLCRACSAPPAGAPALADWERVQNQSLKARLTQARVSTLEKHLPPPEPNEPKFLTAAASAGSGATSDPEPPAPHPVLFFPAPTGGNDETNPIPETEAAPPNEPISTPVAGDFEAETTLRTLLEEGLDITHCASPLKDFDTIRAAALDRIPAALARLRLENPTLEPQPLGENTWSGALAGLTLWARHRKPNEPIFGNPFFIRIIDRILLLPFLPDHAPCTCGAPRPISQCCRRHNSEPLTPAFDQEND